MTHGLVKSVFLHFGIFILFLYGAEIFKQNKRFEIYEIPLDVVDVAEKTVNKTQNAKEKKVKKKRKDTYDPPKPKTKPTPPEFPVEAKKKVKQKKQKKQKKKEEQNKKEDKKRMASILKSIEKIKTQTKNINDKDKEDKKEDEKKQDDIKDVNNVSLGEKLTISELDMIKRQFYDCWIVPAGAKNLKNLIVSIQLKLDESGTVINSKLMNEKKLGDPFFRAAAESAIRAVNHPECRKLKVPKKKYEIWKSLILDFNPAIMFN
jgi:hypothetical protein